MNATLAALERAEEFKRKAKASVDTDEKLSYLAASVDVLIEAVMQMARAEIREQAAA